jgi:uncharacterized protein
MAFALPLAGGCTAQAELPTFSAPVVDNAGIVGAVKEQALNNDLEAFKLGNGPQIAVLTVSSTGSQSIEDFAIDVARSWGVGDAVRDDGVLIVVAIDDRQLRIETGSGVEADITDVQTSRIIESVMKPLLRANDPEAAVDQGARAVMLELSSDTALNGVTVGPSMSGTPNGQAPRANTDGISPWSWVAQAGFFLLVALLAALAQASQRRRSGGAYTAGGSWMSSSGGGGFSGGFSGGGGGGFSGGGSSGSW